MGACRARRARRPDAHPQRGIRRCALAPGTMIDLPAQATPREVVMSWAYGLLGLYRPEHADLWSEAAELFPPPTGPYPAAPQHPLATGKPRTVTRRAMVGLSPQPLSDPRPRSSAATPTGCRSRSGRSSPTQTDDVLGPAAAARARRADRVPVHRQPRQLGAAERRQRRRDPARLHVPSTHRGHRARPPALRASPRARRWSRMLRLRPRRPQQRSGVDPAEPLTLPRF